MTVLDLMAADEVTVLFSFDDPSGVANPSTVRTVLGAGLDVGSVVPELMTSRVGNMREVVTGRDAGPVAMSVPLIARAASYTALRAGLGQLAAWLDDPPGPLRWTEGGVIRYIDLIGAAALPALIRGQTIGGLISVRSDSLGPIPLTLIRQFGMRGAAITTSGVTVPMDPATGTKVRVYPVTIAGDLPTPAVISVTMDASAKVRHLRIGHRARGAEPASFLADYLSDTGFLQAEASGRGWTVTLGQDTAGTTDASASPGSGTSAARVTPVVNPTVMARRVRAVRSTKLASLRGTWDVIARAEATTAGATHEVQLRWGLSSADPVANPNPAVSVIRPTAAVTGEYGEFNLGRITIPAGVTLGGLALEVWSRRVSGSGNLDIDWLWLCPADDVATLELTGSAEESWGGNLLTSPPAQITGDPVWTAGSVVGTSVTLNDLDEAVGTPPNTGVVWGAGQHTFTYRMSWAGTGMDLQFRVVNITDQADVAETVTLLGEVPRSGTVIVRFDGVAGKAYQAQVGCIGYSFGGAGVLGIDHTFTAGVGASEVVRSDPGPRYAADHLDSAGGYRATLTAAGALPAVLPPGDVHVMLAALDIPGIGFAYDRSILARTPTVAITYSPRYAL